MGPYWGMLALALLATSVTSGITLAQDGKTSWVIVAADQPPALHHGAEELQSTLKAVTGATFAIVQKLPRGTKGIRVAFEPNLGEEEYTIRTDAQGVVIRGGGKRGAMYGCYGFLQDVVGCRWFTAKASFLPLRKTLTIPSLNVREKPAFEYREPFFTEAFTAKDWCLRNRVNGNSMPLDDAVGGKVSYGKFVHTFSELVPPSVYFKDHPEYFSQVQGARQSGYTQLCLTNPDVLKITIAKVEDWIRENPSATIFSVSQNDTYYQCECDACRAVEAEEGSPSGPLLRFVNKVADAIAVKHPKVLIDTLAYQWSEKPPLKEKPHKNVRVRLAPIYACFSHPLDGCDKNKLPLSNLQTWAKVTNQLYIWHYCTDFANYLQPLPCLDEMVGDLRIFKANGVVGVFEEGAYPPGGGADMAELKSYVLARMMWNPSLPAKPIIWEFLTGVYGKAAPQMQAWLDLTHRGAREQKLDATIYDPPTAPYFPDDLLVKGEALFNEAEAAVANDSNALWMVQKARMALEYLQVTRIAADDPRRPALVKSLAAKIRRFGVTQTSEGGPAENFLQRIGG